MSANDYDVFEGWSNGLGLENLEAAVEGGEDLWPVAIVAIVILAGLVLL